MIKVDVSGNKIEIRGHAKYARTGADIVCAAVSTLTFTLLNSLSAMCEDEFLCEEDDGEMCITFQGASQKGQILIDAFLIGIAGIEKEYPNYVKLMP